MSSSAKLRDNSAPTRDDAQICRTVPQNVVRLASMGVVDTIQWEGVWLYDCMYQMLFTDLTGATNHGIEAQATSGKSQEEETSSLSTCLCCERGGYIAYM